MSANFSESTIEWGVNTITLLDLMKQILGITDTSRDTELSLHLQAAGEACESYCDNILALDTVSENIAKTFTPVPLRYWPVGALTSVFVDGDDVTADWEEFTDDGIHWVVKERCNIDKNCCFEQMVITYDAGYEPLPADLGYAIVIVGLNYEAERGAVSGAIKRETVHGVGTVEYSTSEDAVVGVGLIPPAAIGTLDKYRRYHV